MTKRDIVLKISGSTGIKQTLVKKVVQKTFDTIFDALKDKQRIEIRNFGIFYLKKRKKRIGRNPKTGQVVPIPERNTVLFKPGLEMKRAII